MRILEIVFWSNSTEEDEELHKLLCNIFEAVPKDIL